MSIKETLAIVTKQSKVVEWELLSRRTWEELQLVIAKLLSGLSLLISVRSSGAHPYALHVEVESPVSGEQRWYFIWSASKLDSTWLVDLTLLNTYVGGQMAAVGYKKAYL